MKKVYAAYPEVLHPAAGASVSAHLLKLEREGRVRRDARQRPAGGALARSGVGKLIPRAAHREHATRRELPRLAADRPRRRAAGPARGRAAVRRADPPLRRQRGRRLRLRALHRSGREARGPTPAGARRLPGGRRGLGARLPARIHPLRHRRRADAGGRDLRVGGGLHDHGILGDDGHRVGSPGPAALARHDPVARRHGDHRLRHRADAPAGRGRHAALQGRDGRTGGEQDHAARGGDGPAALVDLPGPHRQRGAAADPGRDGPLRRRLPRPHERFHRRLLDPQRLDRRLRLAADRVDRDRLHDDRAASTSCCTTGC